jgi:hypothetical protein
MHSSTTSLGIFRRDTLFSSYLLPFLLLLFFTRLARGYLSWAGSCLGEIGIYIRYLIFQSKKIIESISVCSTSLAFWRRITKASERLAEDESDNGASGPSTASLCGGFEAAA